MRTLSWREKGQAWEAFVRNFAAAMSTREVAEESLEDTLLGKDIGGEQWLAERHDGGYDDDDVWHEGHLMHPNGPSAPQARAHTRRCKHLFGYLYKHVADLRLQEMISIQAQGDGRAAFLLLNQACRRDVTDLELTQLNQDFDNASIEKDVSALPVTPSPSSAATSTESTLAARRTCARTTTT